MEGRKGQARGKRGVEVDTGMLCHGASCLDHNEQGSKNNT